MYRGSGSTICCPIRQGIRPRGRAFGCTGRCSRSRRPLGRPCFHAPSRDTSRYHRLAPVREPRAPPASSGCLLLMGQAPAPVQRRAASCVSPAAWPPGKHRPARPTGQQLASACCAPSRQRSLSHSSSSPGRVPSLLLLAGIAPNSEKKGLHSHKVTGVRVKRRNWRGERACWERVCAPIRCSMHVVVHG